MALRLQYQVRCGTSALTTTTTSTTTSGTSTTTSAGTTTSTSTTTAVPTPDNGPFGDFVSLDLDYYRIRDFKFGVSYDGPARLEWRCDLPQHHMPIKPGVFVRFWDDEGTDPDGDPFTALNPIFEGYIEEAFPATETIGVMYVAFDPTYRAADEITVPNVAYEAGELPDPCDDETEGTPPAAPSNSVPRLIYNSKILGDPDTAYQVGQDGVVAQVIAGLFEFCYEPLYWLNAAPADHVTYPWVNADLGPLATKPQEKLVFESESIRSAVERCLQQFAPKHRMIFQPGSRYWRIRDLTLGTQRTLTLNDYDATNLVLSLDIRPNMADRCGAVKFVGPEWALRRDFSWSGPLNGWNPTTTTTSTSTTSTTTAGYYSTELVPIASSGQLLQTYTASGTFEVWAYTQWQIVDTTQRRGALRFENPETLQLSNFVSVTTMQPVLLLSWDGGDSWSVARQVDFDPVNGIANMHTAQFVYVDPAPISGSTQKYFVPNAVRLVWAPLQESLTVRYPSSGFQGTAYTLTGRGVERVYYDEALAVGREFGVPVTTAVREEQFRKLAQSILEERQDITYAGGCSLAGARYDFCRLHRRVNIAAVDGDNAALTTGWETAKAIVTECEIDFTNDLTTLVFSSDQLQLMGEDVQALKERLNIRAMQQLSAEVWSPIFSMRALPSGKVIREVTGMQRGMQFAYVNPEAGG